MRVSDLNNILVEDIESVIDHTYSMVVGSNESVFLVNPKVDFDGTSLTILDDSGYKRNFPSYMRIIVGGESVFIYSPDKSVRVWLYGMEELSSKNKLEYHRYFSRKKFVEEVNDLEVKGCNPLVAITLYELISKLEELDGSNPYNRIKLSDEKDLLFTIQNKDENVYTLSEEESGMDITSNSLQNVIDEAKRFWSDSLGVGVQYMEVDEVL